MALITGPFTVKYGSVTLADVSELSWDYSADSSQPTTIDGRTFDIPTTTTASVTVTLLGADVAALTALFPGYAVAKNGTMSTGETATADEGAFDLTASGTCGSSQTKDDLEIIGCTHTTRLVNATVRISSIDYEDNVIQTVQVTFTGTPEQGEGVIQMYANGSLQS